MAAQVWEKFGAGLLAGVIEGDLDPLWIAERREWAVFGTGFSAARASEQTVFVRLGAGSPHLLAVLRPELTVSAVFGRRWDADLFAVAAGQLACKGVAGLDGGDQLAVQAQHFFRGLAEPRGQGGGGHRGEECGVNFVGHDLDPLFGGRGDPADQSLSNVGGVCQVFLTKKSKTLDVRVRAGYSAARKEEALKLRDYLKREKLKASELARKVGCSKQHLSLILRERHVLRLDIAARIVEATDGAVGYADLLPSVGETDPEGTNPSDG